ncbi:MAG TPA: hypothetical protein VFF06_16270 [Polyangia bacterium]|nr:hypothetical protein [Polyangia bacterium]
MSSLRPLVPLLALASLGGACTPYPNLDGDFYAGPIDPHDFPAAYQGAGYDPAGAFGNISPIPATVAGGAPIAYYSFPVSAGVMDPLLLRSETVEATPAIADRAAVYLFDGDDAHDSAKCVPPSPNYVFDVHRDFVRFDRQGNVFQEKQLSKDAPSLPSDSGYAPIYAESPAVSAGEGCQTVHSAEGLMANAAVTVTKAPIATGARNPVGVPDGKYLAMAVIDPSANVLNPDGSLDRETALGPQRFGWFNHFLVAYLEGGYVPTAMQTVPGMMGAPDTKVTLARAATLYAPNTMCDPTAPAGAAAPCVGLGFDVIDGVDSMDATRGQAGYSPICKVRTFTPADPTAPPSDPAAIDPATLDPDTNTFVYCLQVAQ